jgi:glycosyltransferase involved in cell wall biosynthesis
LHKVTIARWLVDLARDRYGDREVSLVENSVDTALFHAGPRSKQPRPTIGYLYSTSPIKGCEVSFRAIARLREAMPLVHVVSFGAEPPSADLPLPPETEFTLRPAQVAIRDLYSRLDVWLCGSRTEGFHLPPLEAMACRTPVVSTRVGGAVETVEPGVNGFLTEVGDHEALAASLRQVLELDVSGWKRMSDAAYARAHRYTWEDATALFEQALERAIERAGRGEIAGVRGGVRIA